MTAPGSTRTAAVAPPSSGPLQGWRVDLAPVVPEHYEPLYRLLVDQAPSVAWSYRDQTPTFDAFLDSLWRDVLIQAVIRSRRSGAVLGLIVAYQPNFRDRHVTVSMYMDPAATLRGYSTEAAALFFAHLFATYDFLKIYGRNPGYTQLQFSSGAGSWYRVEACLVDHDWYMGRFWDMTIVAIYRDEWAAIWEPRIARLRRAAG